MCTNNKFGKYCSDNTFGNLCEGNTFGKTGMIKSYYRHIVFEDYNSYIALICTEETSSEKYYQNVRIGFGVNNSTTVKEIEDGNVNQTYVTLYKPENSHIITV